MTTVARLSADLYANVGPFESGLARADRAMQQSKQQWNSAFAQVSRSAQTFGGSVARSAEQIVDFKSQLGGVAAAAASAFSLQKIVQYSDMWKQTSSRLALVTDGTRDLTQVQDQLFSIAQRNSAPVNDTVDAYVRLNNSLKDSQKEQYNLMTITELLAKTLKISGTNAQGSAIFLQQFGQAASNDFKAIGQELQTFADQNPTFYKIIRDEAEKSGQTLKEFAKEGGLSFDFIAKALQNAAGQINSDAESIQLTVGQSLTQLDNAFLKFIGQNKLAVAGTSSLAGAISGLAKNFEFLGLAAGAVAAVFAGRLIQSLTASAALWVANTGQAIAYQAALARMAGVTATAATATVTLSAAATGLRAALGFLGGPVGIALIAALTAYSVGAMNAAKAQQAMNLEMGEFRAKADEYMNASADTRKQIEADTDAKIQAYENELKALQKIIDLYAELDSNSWMDAIGAAAASTFGPMMGGDSLDTAQAKIEAINQSLAEMKNLRENMGKPRTGGGSGSSGGEDEVKKIIRGLQTETQELILQVDYYGKKESVIKRAQRELRVNQQLAEKGIVLTQKQRAEVDKYLDAIERESEKMDELEKQKKAVEEAEKRRKDAMMDLSASFESAFEDAILSGKELGDVLQGLADDILKLLIRSQITQPLAAALTGANGSGGGLFDDIFGWMLPSYAVGTSYVPHDMVANIHKGEMIIPADQAAMLRGGSPMGDGDFVLNINNNNGSKVTQSRRQTSNGTELNVNIDDAFAEMIATPGSKTNQALKNRDSQALVRRN